MAWFRKKNAGDFDSTVRRLIAEHAPRGATIVDEGDSIRVGESVTNLSNMRRHWNELDESERLPWLSRSVSALLNPPAVPEQLTDLINVWAAVRARSMYEIAMIRATLTGDDSSRVPNRPIAGDLAWVVVFDTPHSMMTVNQGQLDQWGVSFEELLEAGISNVSDFPIAAWSALGESVFSAHLEAEVDYTGARLLAPGGLDDMPGSVIGEYVVFHPTRTTLLVTGATDDRGIGLAAEFCLELLDASGQVSFAPIVGDGNSWRPLELPSTHAAFEPWRRLCVVDEMYAYNGQQDQLQPLLGEEMFVSGYNAIEAADGVISVCSWTEGAPSLLPRTGHIAFVADDRSAPVIAPWSAAQAVTGHRMEPTGHYPERWRVLSFPDPDEMAQLRLHALD